MEQKDAWILVEVRRGIPVNVKLFSDEILATAHEQKLRKELNLEDDETAVFHVEFDDIIVE